MNYLMLQIFRENSVDLHATSDAESSSSMTNNRPTKNTNNTSTAAACLLVMDDNHRLVEWLAYHHYTTNLRHMIVAVDPRSSTSPQPILDRYLSKDLNYIIVKDDDFMGNRMLDKRNQMHELGRKHLTLIHRVRQKAFYQYCLERLYLMGLTTWTLLIDVDEYLVVNDDKDDDDTTTEPLLSKAKHHEIMSTPGGILEYLHTTARQAATQPDNPQYEQFHSPCVSIPRLLFGTKKQDAQPTTMILPNHPQLQLQLQQLDTMQWFYHADALDNDRNGLGKTILDLSRIAIPKPHFPHPVNPHRPFQEFCRDPKRIRDLNRNAHVRVHHYIGTWETYSFRNDSRKGAERSREAWEFRAFGSDSGGLCRDIEPWLEGFVQYHGASEASRLLQGAGLPSTYTHPPHVNDQWKFLFAEEYVNKKGAKNAAQYDSNYGQFLRNRTATKHPQG